MFKAKIEADLLRVIKELRFVKPTDTVLSIQENPLFGDYSSNVALQLSKQKHHDHYQNPREIANAILEKLDQPGYLKQIEVAGPGFINFFIKDEQLILALKDEIKVKLEANQSKKYLVEYGDPNTHKMLHIGHMVPLILGESMARLLEFGGGVVYRVNYGSDIGLTVGKCLWGIEHRRQDYDKVKSSGDLRQKAEFLGVAYAFAHKAYTENSDYKLEIDELTKKIYNRDADITKLWQETAQWSLSYFNSVYSQLGVKFDRRINESEVESLGKKIVLAHMGTIFVKDQGAVIFQGEKHGLHNRVFLNSAGNPTYEAKDVGLTQKYFELDNFDTIYSFAHREQNEYFRVVLKAIELIYGEEGKKRKHVSFGELRLPSGKMSSREGNVIAAEEMIEMVSAKVMEVAPKLSKESVRRLAVGSIKFWFLKYSSNSDIIFDFEKSVSLQGDSGPYVMYVYARIQSLMNRASDFTHIKENVQIQKDIIAQTEEVVETKVTKATDATKVFKGVNTYGVNGELEPEERMVLRELEYFEVVAEMAVSNLQPNLITTYLLELCKTFNSFYEKCAILHSNRQEFRILLAKKVAETVKIGLYLLGIETVDRM